MTLIIVSAYEDALKLLLNHTYQVDLDSAFLNRRLLARLLAKVIDTEVNYSLSE